MWSRRMSPRESRRDTWLRHAVTSGVSNGPPGPARTQSALVVEVVSKPKVTYLARREIGFGS